MKLKLELWYSGPTQQFMVMDINCDSTDLLVKLIKSMTIKSTENGMFYFIVKLV